MPGNDLLNFLNNILRNITKRYSIIIDDKGSGETANQVRINYQNQPPYIYTTGWNYLLL